MESLVQPDRLRARVLVWAEEEVRARRSFPHRRRGFSRRFSIVASCRVARWTPIAGTGDRQGRRILQAG